MDRERAAHLTNRLMRTDVDPYVDCYVVATGAGLAMAATDHLTRAYPDCTFQAIDLPGHWGLERRAMLLDYLLHCGPTCFCCWAGLGSALHYPEIVYARGYTPLFPLWTYVRGIDEARARDAWRALGAQILVNIWAHAPLGNWEPIRKIHHAGCLPAIPAAVAGAQHA